MRRIAIVAVLFAMALPLAAWADRVNVGSFFSVDVPSGWTHQEQLTGIAMKSPAAQKVLAIDVVPAPSESAARQMETKIVEVLRKKKFPEAKETAIIRDVRFGPYAGHEVLAEYPDKDNKMTVVWIGSFAHGSRVYYGVGLCPRGLTVLLSLRGFRRVFASVTPRGEATLRPPRSRPRSWVDRTTGPRRSVH